MAVCAWLAGESSSGLRRHKLCRALAMSVHRPGTAVCQDSNLCGAADARLILQENTLQTCLIVSCRCKSTASGCDPASSMLSRRVGLPMPVLWTKGRSLVHAAGLHHTLRPQPRDGRPGSARFLTLFSQSASMARIDGALGAKSACAVCSTRTAQRRSILRILRSHCRKSSSAISPKVGCQLQ